MIQKSKPGAEEPQNQPEKFIVPMAQDPAKAALEAATKAAQEAALQAAAQVQPVGPLNHVPEPPGRTLRINVQTSVRVPRRNQQNPFTWLRSPGTLTFGVISKWKMEDNAEVRGAKLKNGKIEKIRCARYDNEKIVHVWVTDSLDPDGIEVTETKSALVANIATWLFQEGIAPDPGLNQKFDLLDSPELILGKPALCFNLTKAKKITHFDPAGKKSDEEGQASTKGNDKGTSKGKKDAPENPAPKAGEIESA